MRSLLPLLPLAVLGCGRLHYEPRDRVDAGVDAPMDGSRGVDAWVGADAAGPDAPGLDAPDAPLDAADPCARCDVNATCIASACRCNGGFVGDGLTCMPGFSDLEAYVKASNTGMGDGFGYAVALSGDGSTLAIGAWSEDGSGTGVNPPSDEARGDSGAVYVYRRLDATWVFDAYLKAQDTPGLQDAFGGALALSNDGNTLAVSAYLEDGSGTGVNPPSNEGADRSGAVYVYERMAGAWSFGAYLKASNTGASDEFGYSVALSGDGNTLAVGALREDGSGTGVNPTSDEAALDSGAVYIYRRRAGWAFDAYLKASNTGTVDFFGYVVALSENGDTLAVGAIGEDGSGTGLNPTSDEASSESGAVYLYQRVGDLWAIDVYLKSNRTNSNDRFGRAVSLSADGSLLAVGADGERGSGIGVNPTPDTAAVGAGAVFLYRRAAAVPWVFEAYLKASNTQTFDAFGYSVSLSGDGTTVAVGAYLESGAGTRVNPASDEGASASGAAYVYRNTTGVWAFEAYIKASNAGESDNFGRSLSLTRDGHALAVGAIWEDGSGTGINPPSNEGAVNGGAVYVFR